MSRNKGNHQAEKYRQKQSEADRNRVYFISLHGHLCLPKKKGIHTKLLLAGLILGSVLLFADGQEPVQRENRPAPPPPHKPEVNTQALRALVRKSVSSTVPASCKVKIMASTNHSNFDSSAVAACLIGLNSQESIRVGTSSRFNALPTFEGSEILAIYKVKGGNAQRISGSNSAKLEIEKPYIEINEKLCDFPPREMAQYVSHEAEHCVHSKGKNPNFLPVEVNGFFGSAEDKEGAFKEFQEKMLQVVESDAYKSYSDVYATFRQEYITKSTLNGELNPGYVSKIGKSALKYWSQFTDNPDIGGEGLGAIVLDRVNTAIRHIDNSSSSMRISEVIAYFKIFPSEVRRALSPSIDRMVTELSSELLKKSLNTFSEEQRHQYVSIVNNAHIQPLRPVHREL